MTSNLRNEKILNDLNAYENRNRDDPDLNIWEDVIYCIDDVDDDATSPDSSAFKLEDGTEFFFNPQLDKWVIIEECVTSKPETSL